MLTRNRIRAAIAKLERARYRDEPGSAEMLPSLIFTGVMDGEIDRDCNLDSVVKFLKGRGVPVADEDTIAGFTNDELDVLESALTIFANTQEQRIENRNKTPGCAPIDGKGRHMQKHLEIARDLLVRIETLRTT